MHMRTLDEHLTSDQSFSSAYARAIGALAATEGVPTLARFAAVTEIAGEGKASAVFTAIVLNSIESAVDIDWALHGLSRSASGLEPAARSAALAVAMPLLALHGAEARGLAQRLAKALAVKLAPEDLAQLPPAEERGLLANLGEQARRVFRGRSLVDAVADFGRQTGQAALVEHAHNFQAGYLDLVQLVELVGAASRAISQDVAQYQEQARNLSLGEASAACVIGAATEFRQQVLQRLTLLDDRILHERRLLVEEIEDAVHDAGNAIELAMNRRPDSGAPAGGEGWAAISRLPLVQTMEQRLDRLAQRKVQALHLLQEDLRLFQSALRISQTQVFQRQHHAALARLMPRLRIGTGQEGGGDGPANAAAVSEALAAAGASTAAYLFSATVVLPVLATAAPFASGAALLGGVFKALAQAAARPPVELRALREAFEAALRKQLHDDELAFHQQLDMVHDCFHDTALQLLTPIMLEAEAAGRVHGMRQRVADRAIAQAQGAIQQLEAELRR